LIVGSRWLVTAATGRGAVLDLVIVDLERNGRRITRAIGEADGFVARAAG